MWVSIPWQSKMLGWEIGTEDAGSRDADNDASYIFKVVDELMENKELIRIEIQTGNYSPSLFDKQL